MDSGGLSDFISQVWGLVVLTVGSGILWVVLMVVISRRAAERRRRKQQGLEPLPSFFTQAWHWIKQQMEEKPKPAVVEEASPSPAPSYATAVPTPDFDLLTNDLPLPDFHHLTTPLEDELDAILTPVKAGEIVEPVTPPLAAPPPPPPMPAITPSAQPVTESIAMEAPVYSVDLNYVPGSNELPHDAVEVMRVWRDVTDGTLIVGIKDQLFATSGELRNADIARRFSGVMRELNALALAAGLSVGSVAAPAPAPVRPVASPPAAAPRSGKKGEIPEPVEPPKIGIADEIEAYLQQRLAGTPRFANRSIHVRAGKGGGVSIEVDGRTYEAVTDVEDLIVKDFLQATIQEWSEHH